MNSILIIEDDYDIAQLISHNLKDIHCECKIEHTGLDGQLEALNGTYDLIILDITLPEKNGIDICKELRVEKIFTPILMLTARVEEIDRVLGLESGADDYLTKPFSIRELQARVKAIIRRSQLSSYTSNTHLSGVIQSNDLVIDFNKRIVVKNQKRVELTPKEFNLLQLMAKNPGKTYSRSQLLNKVWGYDYAGYEHTVNSHINRLRIKIETDLANPQFIFTTWGVGYRFTDEVK